MSLSVTFQTSQTTSYFGGNPGGVVQIPADLNRIFDAVQPSEAVSGLTDYRLIWITNSSSSAVKLVGLKAYFSSQTSSPDTAIAIGLGPTNVAYDVGYPAAETNDTTAPTGVTFSSPSSVATALALGTLDYGKSTFLWLRRTVTAGAAAAAVDTCSLVVTNAVS